MKLAGDMERMMDQAEAARKSSNDKGRVIVSSPDATSQQKQQAKPKLFAPTAIESRPSTDCHNLQCTYTVIGFQCQPRCKRIWRNF